MKKSLLFLTAIMLMFIANGYSQAFSTGAMNVNLSKYGRIRLYTPDATLQLDRSSILVGTTKTAVFDYANDALQLTAPVTVATPLKSDFEVTGAINGGSATTPPDVNVTINAYGWTNQAYTIVKYNVKNNEATAMNASIGLDMIPVIGGNYLDSISYSSSTGVLRFFWGAGVENIGIKLLSASLTSVNSFVWYDGYEVDSTYWNWMKKGSLQPLFVSTNDPLEGTVTVTAQAPVAIAPGASVNVYYAYAIGANQQTLLNNLTAATTKYNAVFTGVSKLEPSALELKNYPNPVKSATRISYQLPKEGLVSLKIYDTYGREITTLVNTNQSTGFHTVDFDPKGLSSGVYMYRLCYNGKVITNKMLINK